MKTLTLLLLATALSCQAQTSPTIKGHKLGESLQEFVNNASPTTTYLINSCKSDTDSENYSWCVGIYGITTLLAKPDVSPTGIDMKCDTKAVDFQNVGALASPLGKTYIQSWCADFDGEITFEGNKLVRIQTKIIPTGPWSQSYSSLVNKFGKPTTTQSQVLQNGFGARFRTTDGLWVSKGYSVRAQELLNDDLSRYVTVEMMTPAYAHEQIQEEQKAHANTLD